MRWFSVLFHSSTIKFSSSVWFLGFLLITLFFNKNQNRSIGFKSGLLDGCVTREIPWLRNELIRWVLLCGGALSCCILKLFPIFSCIAGINSSKTKLWYTFWSIFCFINLKKPSQQMVLWHQIHSPLLNCFCDMFESFPFLHCACFLLLSIRKFY